MPIIIQPDEQYMHYKTGNQYTVIGLARHSESEEELVVYQAEYTDGTFPMGQLWCRPVAMFTEMVEYEGKRVKRFTKIRG